MKKMPDPCKIAAAFHHKAVTYDSNVFVQKRVVAQLADAVNAHLPNPPENVLDVGTGTGALVEQLHARYQRASFTAVDIALNMCMRTRHKLGGSCHIVNGAAESLPFQTGTFDLVVSASVLQWVNNLSSALYEMRRVLRPGGSVSLAFFCSGTLAEMQNCFRDAVSKCCDHSQRESRLHDFWSVEDLTSIVSGMDFERAVITVETEVDWYDDLYSLLRSIKSIGAGAVSGGGSKTGLGWRGILQEASRLYQQQYGQAGRIPATYKVVYLTAQAKP